MTTAAAQNVKTIQFWDDYYSSSSSSSAKAGDQTKEWILHPSRAILETLYEKLPPPSSSATPNNNNANHSDNDDDDDDDDGRIRILEIGCGTSTLSRDFWLYCRTQKGRRDISVCATDVSHVCLHQNQERDRELLQIMTATNEGCLEYKFLNITTPLEMIQPESDHQEDEEADRKESQSTSHLDHNCPNFLPRSFDMILDKGCLDTFLFRSRSRGDQKDALIRTVLDNIHSLLKDPLPDDTAQSRSSSSRRRRGGVFLSHDHRGIQRDDAEQTAHARCRQRTLD